MISCKNIGHGRFGNNLFAIAATLGLALKHRVPYTLPTNWKYYDAFVGSFYKSDDHYEVSYVEPHFHYAEIPPMFPVDLVGYYQSKRYWEHCEDEIRTMFTFKPEIIKEVRAFIDQHANGKIPVFCHFRRGDYVKEMAHYYHELSMTWYAEAMNRFDDNTHHFFCLSDDINYVKQNLHKRGNVTFSRFDEVHDLCLMSECSHGIMCNSSFSWWGQYLIKNPGKHIIAPTKDKWFKPVAGHNVDDLYYGNNWELL